MSDYAALIRPTHCAVDNSLIGGVVIRAGDLVIDASLRGRLGQLAQALV